MTPGQLIDLLEKAGMLKEESPGVLGWHPTMQKAERFAALVAAAEREACANLCETSAALIWEYHPEQVKTVGESVCINLAAAIRARGEKDAP